MRKYTHSIQGKESTSWEELSAHLQEVSMRTASFANPFGWSEMARAADLLTAADTTKWSDSSRRFPRVNAGGKLRRSAEAKIPSLRLVVSRRVGRGS